MQSNLSGKILSHQILGAACPSVRNLETITVTKGSCPTFSGWYTKAFKPPPQEKKTRASIFMTWKVFA